MFPQIALEESIHGFMRESRFETFPYHFPSQNLKVSLTQVAPQ